ncbi:MAG: glutathione peroxidase [Clostridia bacterium]|nr:glutathione peroxidase [Clostridia bacterium]MBP5592570.1 glutathione peroxidase [Clostridia bacterium]MBP5649008.1 glutathione peroxidase [Clostridia bacterium]
MSIYDYKVKKRRGEELDLKDMEGKVLLVVNTATGCGFTPQYEALENLYEKYNEKGLEVLDFPCNQFGNQAPGEDEEIHEFCTAKYKTKFDQLAKIDVNGENESPVYTFLKSQIKEDEIKGFGSKITMKAISGMSKSAKNPEDIKWNFTKFLVDRNGNVIKRYSPTYKPEDIEKDIIEALG